MTEKDTNYDETQDEEFYDNYNETDDYYINKALGNIKNDEGTARSRPARKPLYQLTLNDEDQIPKKPDKILREPRDEDFKKRINDLKAKNKHFDNYKVLGQEKKSVAEMDPHMLDYIRDREELERLAHQYFIKECGCDERYLDKNGNTIFYYNPPDSKRGGEVYTVPVGWMGFGIEVTERYKYDQDWIASDGRKGEWAVAYHGFGCAMQSQQIKSIIKTIIHDNLKPGGGQAYQGAPDSRHPGRNCGTGVYITPDINVAYGYAGMITLGKKNYKLVIMVRVNMEYVRIPTSQPNYWIIDGKTDQLRPYRLLIKDMGNNYNNQY